MNTSGLSSGETPRRNSKRASTGQETPSGATDARRFFSASSICFIEKNFAPPVPFEAFPVPLRERWITTERSSDFQLRPVIAHPRQASSLIKHGSGSCIRIANTAGQIWCGIQTGSDELFVGMDSVLRTVSRISATKILKELFPEFYREV